jgi:hypothetical protein
LSAAPARGSSGASDMLSIILSITYGGNG